MLTEIIDSVFNPQDCPVQTPPAPAGRALLDNSETNFLVDFLDYVDAGQMDGYEDFYVDQANQNKISSDLDFWGADALPPTFHGSAMSYSNQSAAQATNAPLHSSTDYNFPQSHDYFSRQVQATSASSEVLAAASTLSAPMSFQNSADPRSSCSSKDLLKHSFIGYNARDAYIAQQTSTRAQQTFAGTLIDAYDSHPTTSNGSEGSSLSLPQNIAPSDGHTALYDLVAGQNAIHHSGITTNAGSFEYGEQLSIESGTRTAADLPFGTDAGFSNRPFVAPANHKTEEEVTRNMLENIDCLEEVISAANTCPSTPRSKRRKEPANMDIMSLQYSARARGDIEREAEPAPPSRKRRKIKVKVEIAEEQESDSLPAPAKGGKRKSKKPSQEDASPASTASQSGNQKSRRKNLTNEQKRSNHIISEQKRRDLISAGYNNLCELVPGLKNAGYSKSVMLQKAADWLETFMQGNKTLELQLAEEDNRRCL